VFALLLLVAHLWICAGSLNAQVLYGSITGNVTDTSGAVIPGAKVVVHNVATGTEQTATTDDSGIYRISEVLPGTYKVTISAANFAAFDVVGAVVNANEVRRVDARLEVKRLQEVVTVEADQIPLLETDRSDVHADFSSAQIAALPLISSEGASFQAIYKLIPGATIPFENNSAGGNPQRAMTTNVNGQSSQGNNTRIDGIQDAYPWLPNNIAYVPPEDAIDSVNVVTNSFDAEQGDAAGAAVNVQLKSGTNSFHGDVHELYTADALWALSYFANRALPKPVNVFNQFGGAFGGPIKRDKLFFFGDWESTRQAQAPSGGNPQTVPAGGLSYASAQQNGFFDFRGLLTDKAGNAVHIYDPRTGNPDGTNRQPISCNGVIDEICLSAVDPAALKMISLIPGANAAGTTNNYYLTKKGTFNRDDFDTKINYVPNQRMMVFGRYSFSQSNIFDPPALGAAGGNATLGGQNGYAYSRIQLIGLGATYTFSPNVLLDMNGGFTRQRINAEDTDIGSNFGSDTLKIPGTNGADPLQGGIPAFQFVNYSNLGNANTGNPFKFRDNQYVSNANITWIKGRHQLRFGLEYNHAQINHFQPQGGSFQTARGSFRFTGAATEQTSCTGGKCTNPDPPAQGLQFNSLADFLLGLPDEVGKAVQNINPIALRWNQWALYGRDQYQVNSKLTVNFGLRWEFYPMAYSDIGGARVLNTGNMQVLVGGGNSGVPTNDGVQVGEGLFLPRIGIAYRPMEKTVIRVGYGISGDSNNWRFLRNAYPADTISDFVGNSYPQALNSAFAPAASLTGLNATGPYTYLPTGITLIPVNGGTTPGVFALPKGVSTTTIPLNFRRGYINQWNLAVEREIHGFVASVSYVGSVAVRPLTNMNVNAAPAGGGQTGRALNSEFGGNWSDINQLTPFGNNYYDALQTKLTRSFRQGSQFGVVYTLSKTIDYEDNEEINFLIFPYPAYANRNKAVAGFDRTHNFETYYVWALPFGKGQRWVSNGLASKIVGGWQLNGILTLLSGLPFTLTDSGAGASALNAPGNTQTVNQVGAVQIINGAPPVTASKCTTANMQTCFYFNPNAFARVTTPATFGNVGRNTLRGPGYVNLDSSLYRNFKLTERFTFQFQANAFSITNTPHFANPVSDYNNANFGKITGTLVTTNASLGGSGGQRQWWFAGKLIF
jgi:hypothetical protein